MPKRLKKPATDPNVAAFNVVSRLTGDNPAPDFKAQLSAYMSKLGKKGGKTSGAKRMENLTEEKRRAIASQAARKRWDEVAKRKAAKKR